MPNDPRAELITVLHELVSDLTMESQDTRYTLEERGRLLDHAKAVRKRRMQLRTMQFDTSTQGYSDVTLSLSVVNDEIESAIDRINDLVKFFGDLAKLTKAIDQVIKTAAALV